MVIKASLKPNAVYFCEHKYSKYYRDGSSGQTIVWPCLVDIVYTLRKMQKLKMDETNFKIICFIMSTNILRM